MYVDKIKQKKDIFDGLFIFQRYSTLIFFSECKNILSKLF